ncbi:MAG: amidohydrolase [Flavobacteriales bacterium]|nr:amidohydrolase [Flavobacteriales bacterium]
MIELIKQEAQRQHAAIVGWRRHLHAHPELSYQETETGKYISSQLRLLGIEVREPVAGTGVIGLVRGERPGDGCICLRGDIDALPIQEQNTCDYRSVNDGIMHACGHDAHAAMVLGAGAILHALRKEWGGTVMLLFQPGEEKIPGGATLVLKENALSDPTPSSILGQHCTPELPFGKIGFREGPFMASSDELYVTVKGKGGHAAQPERLIDPITITAHLLLALKEEFAAYRPSEKTILAFGRVEALGATNVVPDHVHIAGTLRAFSEPLRDELHEWLPRRAQEICASYGGSCDFEVRKGYPVLMNDDALTARMRSAAEALVGPDNVVRMEQRMGSEDFAFYTHVMPGCFLRLGTGAPGQPMRGLHTPTFDIDEEALRIGSAIMAFGAVEELSPD